MATAPASRSGTLLQEATPCTPRDTPCIAEATDDPAPPRKCLRRSNRQEEANGECEHDKNAAAPAAAPFLSSETPPPLQKVASAPLFGSDACDDGIGLWLIDVSSLSKGLEHLCCRQCSEEKIDKRTRDFINFHAEKVNKAKMKHPSLEESHKQFKINEKNDNCSGTTCSCLVSVSMSSKTVGFATTLNFYCHETPHSVSVEPQKVSTDFYDGTSENCHVEDTLGPVVQKVAADSKEKGIELEREATKRKATENNKNVSIVDRRVGLIVSSDTHWPRRGGGGEKYLSPSGLTYMIGSLTGMIFGSHVCSQDCRTCHYFEKKLKAGKTKPGETVRAHRCPRFFSKTKSPKTMETTLTVIMVKGIFDSIHQKFVEYRCMDDDTTMMSHTSKV
eukprot:scaffold33915_cov72-Attheya_sp.AAC.1